MAPGALAGGGRSARLDDDDTGECTSDATDSSGVYLEAAPVSCPAGYTQNPDGSCSPASLAVVASGPALPPGSVSTSTGTVVNNPSAIGTSAGCPSGYVVGSAYGGWRSIGHAGVYPLQFSRGEARLV